MSLENLLRARLGHAMGGRALVHINADRVFLTLGALGEHRRISLRIEGDDITVVDPKPAEPEGPPDFDKMTKARLTEFAKANDLDVDLALKVDPLREAIKEAFAAKEGGSGDGTPPPPTPETPTE